MQHFQELYDYNPLDNNDTLHTKNMRIFISKINNKQEWISVKDRLPEDRTIVWIYAVYEDSSYDDVKDRVSIGIFYNNEAWSDLLDFPFADDYTVLCWMPLQFPEKPSQKV